ncbi:Uncharacterized protein Adt_23632 [Abeliophyllum distichum]|uniref:Uncharacterized protein n=1 Tax=Abeliophyllum distichum TaxID=126358 RepID=A0ABD1SEE7_9LAMI
MVSMGRMPPSNETMGGDEDLAAGDSVRPKRVRFMKTPPRFHYPFKRLTDVELQAKKEKGICFTCDEKYNIGHWCKNKELQILIMSEVDIDSEKELETVDQRAAMVENMGESVELSIIRSLD